MSDKPDAATRVPERDTKASEVDTDTFDRAVSAFITAPRKKDWRYQNR